MINQNQIKNLGTKGIPHSKAGKIITRASWRTKTPKINYKKCIKCHSCWLYCPDSAMKIQKNKTTKSDSRTCKGCSVCSIVCPAKCIQMIKEK